MRKLAWSAGFALLTVVAAAAPGCTVTVDSGPPLPQGDDEGGSEPEASTPDETSTGTDSGGAGTDTGSTTLDAGADGAAACSLGVDTGSAVCDACIESACCDTLVACDGEPTDAGTTECEDIDSCYGDCLAPPAGSGVEAGTPSDCADLCSTGHSTTGKADFQGLVACISGSCSIECQ